jgi:hypothetical protein
MLRGNRAYCKTGTGNKRYQNIFRLFRVVSQQLEGEIKNKMWTVIEVINLDYTESNDQNLWKKIMQGLGGEFLLWANAPEDISQN